MNHETEYQYLPIQLRIDNRKIVMIGGGAVALHKLGSLLQFTQAVTVVALEIRQEIQDFGLVCIPKPYAPDDLAHGDLVYACTNDRALNLQIARDARTYGKLVLVADDPALCDFISPAIAVMDDLVIAVGSGGRNTKKAVAVRNWIREIYNDLLYTG